MHAIAWNTDVHGRRKLTAKRRPTVIGSPTSPM
jgi:hypothetical protein